MRVVIAHGRDAAWDVPSMSAPAYEASLRYGLDRVGFRPTDLHVSFAFFGGIWRPDSRRPKGHAAGPAGAPAGEMDALPDPGDASIEATALPPFELPRPVRLARLLAGSPIFGPFIRDVLMLAMTDVYQYLGDQRYYAPVNRIMREACQAAARDAEKEGDVDPRVVLVAFSMGAIVAYEVLREADASFPVHALVTCGNPIGLDPVHAGVRARGGGSTPFPPHLASWQNIWCSTDYACGVNSRALTARFPGAHRIESHRTECRPPSIFSPFASHNPYDYLSSLKMGTAVRHALTVAP
jgi:hypothetical protein